MWQTLEHLETDFVEQWISLSRNEKALVMLLALSVSYYFGKNSESDLVNAISALIGMVIVAYLLLLLFSHT